MLSQAIFKFLFLLIISLSFISEAKTSSYETWSPFWGCLTYKYHQNQDSHVMEWKASAIANDLINLNLISLPLKVEQSNFNKTSYPFLDLFDIDYQSLQDRNGVIPNFSIESTWTYSGYDPITFLPSTKFEIKTYSGFRHDFKYENTDKDFSFKLAKISNKTAYKLLPEKYKNLSDDAEEAKDF